MDFFQNLPSLFKYSIYAILIFTVVVYSFIRFAPVFGAFPDEKSQAVIEASENYVNGRFRNLQSEYDNAALFSNSSENGSTLVSWISPPEGKNPVEAIPTLKFQGDSLAEGSFVWLGHSTVLMKTGGVIVMTDPVFNRASPVPIFGKPFAYENPTTIGDLPRVDVVTISHDHYDHLDARAIRDLADSVERFLVPLGVGAHLQRWGVDAKKISELDWHDSEVYGNVEFTLTPAKHFSGRAPGKTNTSLWGSWVVSSGETKVYFSGDGGYAETFKALGERYGPFDIAFVENGAYNADWPDVHMFPSETVQASIDLNAKLLFPIHWSKFDLSIHPWDEPITRTVAEAEQRNVKLVTAMIGEVFTLANPPEILWWKALRD